MKKTGLFSIAAAAGFILTSCSEGDFWPPEKSPDLIGRRVTEELLSREDYMMYRSARVTAIHYAEACAAFGAARLAGLEGDTLLLQRLSRRYRKAIEDSLPNTANHVDANVYGILPLELYRHTGEERFLEQGMELANGQWSDPLPNGMTVQTRFWIDDIWMIGALQVQAYRVSGNRVYLDRAALEIKAYLEKLQQPNGLFHHGEDSPFFWGRGNGWVAAGLAELLSELPEDHPDYTAIMEGYRKMMYALLDYQSESGLWRQLIDHEESWIETSSSAMFGYAFRMGVMNGFLPGSDFKPAYRKAWLALVDYIDDEGRISEVCVGTGKGDNTQYYLDRPREKGDFHGQAPVLWLAWALLADPAGQP